MIQKNYVSATSNTEEWIVGSWASLPIAIDSINAIAVHLLHILMRTDASREAVLYVQRASASLFVVRVLRDIYAHRCRGVIYISRSEKSHRRSRTNQRGHGQTDSVQPDRRH